MISSPRTISVLLTLVSLTARATECFDPYVPFETQGLGDEVTAGCASGVWQPTVTFGQMLPEFFVFRKGK